jgi:hypothetical protein
MFQDNLPANEAREIYKINSILRYYRVNFYYSLRKDCIFIFEGRSIKSRMITAYLLTAIGGILFLMSQIFSSAIHETINNFIVLPLAVLSCAGGIYILYDFLQKIKHNRTKTMLTRSGISFRDKDQFDFWPSEKIKNTEVVQTVSKKAGLKQDFDESKLRKRAKILIYNHLGISKSLIEISHKNRQIGKSDLEEIEKFCTYFINSGKTKNQTDLKSARKLVSIH